MALLPPNDFISLPDPAVPVTRARLSHAATIRINRRVVGAIHTLRHTQSRDVDHEFEINPFSLGLPRSLVPQTLETRELQISRYDLYTQILEDLFGTSELINLSDQFQNFTIREVWTAPGTGVGLISNVANVGAAARDRQQQLAAAGQAEDNNPLRQALGTALRSAIVGAQARQYEYTGCVLTNIGRTISSTDTRVISVDATVTYLERNRIV